MEDISVNEVLKEDVVLNATRGMGNILEDRKKKFLAYFKKDKVWLIFGIFFLIAWLGHYIRTRNLPLLIDVTTGKYIPADLDAFAFLRYAKYILENGQLMSVDYMRYYPWGFDKVVEFEFLSYFIAYLSKFLHTFSSSITIEYTDVIYPTIAFVIGLLFFFLLVKKLFDYKIALLSSLLLSISPIYLARTIAGVSDKEALGMVFFFAGLYLFYLGWEEKKISKTILYSSLAGLNSGLMSLVWGGVDFLVSIITLFVLINIIFLKFNKKQMMSYALWYFWYYLFVIGIKYKGYGYWNQKDIILLFASFLGAVTTFTLFIGLLIYLVLKYNLNDKIEKKFKLPYRLVVVFIAGIIGGILFSIISAPYSLNIFGFIKNFYVMLTSPFGTDRWQLTVSENIPSSLLSLISDAGWKFFLVYLSGSIIFVYHILKDFNRKVKIRGLIIYILFILGISFSRYSRDSIIFNGETFFSNGIMYFGMVLILVVSYLGYYFYSFYNDKESFNKILDIKSEYIFVLIWFFIFLFASRTALRLLFVFSIIISVFAAYLGIKLFDSSLKLNKKQHKFALWGLLFLIFINPVSLSEGFAFGLIDKGIVFGHYERSLNIAKSSRSVYEQQWQIAGKWVRENTPRDAVFAHWWDYGYLVQGGFERATITDGGNAKQSLNHFMGRSVLTAQSETEALEFLKAHNATHLLIHYSDILKYPVFSYIGSDTNFDRYSTLRGFVSSKSEKIDSNKIVKTYGGFFLLDQDFKYKGEFFPKGQSAIIGFLIPLKNINGTVIIENPTAIILKGTKQEQIPLDCVFFNGEELNFNQGGLKGCFQIIPNIKDNEFLVIDGGIYVSEKVRNTLFARLYLFDKPSKYFKLVYRDHVDSNADQKIEVMPIAIFGDGTVGPLKIWEISYPANLNVPEHYYEDVLPNPEVKQGDKTLKDILNF